MNINSATLIYFSPTRTTKTIVESIAQGMQVAKVRQLDLTRPKTKAQRLEPVKDDLLIIGAPVYAGRIPVEAAQRLQGLKGDSRPAVIVVVYGNRAYEDALLELQHLALEMDLVPIAGGAFIGEHSFSSVQKPIAHDRPDPEDLQKARVFGQQVQEKLQSLAEVSEIPTLHVPGNFPYRVWQKTPDVAPVTQETLCTRCEDCIAVCPTEAITVNDSVITDPQACIWCCACVRECPTGARVMEHPRIKQSITWLSTNCGERKEPEVYL